MNDLLLKRKTLEDRRQYKKKNTRLQRILNGTINGLGYGLCVLLFIGIGYAYFGG